MNLMITFSRVLVLAVASIVAVSVSACSGSSESPESTSGGGGGNNPPAANTSGTPGGGDSGSSNPGNTDSGTPGNDNAACANIAGSWSTSGTCGNDQCVIVQAGCNTNFECSDGAASFTGTVTGSDVAYAGTTALGAPGSCRGLLSGGTTITGSCQIGGVACTFTAKKK